MKKYTKRVFAVLLALGLFAGLLGCSSNTAQTESLDLEGSSSDAFGTYLAEESPAQDDAASLPQVADQDRKRIKTVNMTVETENFDGLIAQVSDRAEALGGYLESSNIYNGSYTSDYHSRNASLTIRIPADQLDAFLKDVEGTANVIRKEEEVSDVTLQYVDLESHKKALLAEQESLLSLLEEAESLDEVLALNEQLTQVRYQLESMESQLRTYDNKIDYSTVSLTVEEVQRYEPYAPKSAGERIREGFMQNVYRVGNGISEFFIRLIIALPILAVLAVIVGLFLLIVLLCSRISQKRAAARRARLEQQGVRFNRYGSRIPDSKEKQSDTPKADQ